MGLKYRENAKSPWKSMLFIRGDKGDPGKDGKSAYQSAAEAGYTGTEKDFDKALADVPTHVEDDVRHISEDERKTWNEAASREISWDTLDDRPFGGEVYKDRYDLAERPKVYFDALGYRFYLISDRLTHTQLLQTVFDTNMGPSFTPTESDIVVLGSGSMEYFFLPNLKDNPIACTSRMVYITVDGEKFLLPGAGMFIGSPIKTGLVQPFPTRMYWVDGGLKHETLVVSYRCETNIKPIDEKYLPELPTENWTFTLADGSTVTKAVCVK